jgi:hypothetical protein
VNYSHWVLVKILGAMHIPEEDGDDEDKGGSGGGGGGDTH